MKLNATAILWALAAEAVAASAARPNIVFIITDDQDVEMGSLEYLPLVQRNLIERGTTFRRHYCTVALCCPSRVSLWTGKAAHNTNVTDVMPPHGGYPKFVSQGLNENYLPVWLQESGYNTYYTGKLFNAHDVDNYDKPYPKGFTGSDFLLDPFTYQYLNASFQRNREPPVNYAGEYSTDLIAGKALGFLEEAANDTKPFFLGIAPIACHSNVQLLAELPDLPSLPDLPKFGNLAKLTPPIAAKRHEHLFPDAKVPRKANFNPDKPSGVSWIRKQPKLNDTVIAFNDHFYRARLQALQAVDELVEQVIQRLDALGILDNTYIVYTTDNGYHVSQHRLHPGKECGFEEDIHIPLIIRGPGVPENHSTDIVTTHTDLAPTLLEIIGAQERPDFDGLAIPLTAPAIKKAEEQRHEHVTVEYWGYALGETVYGVENGIQFNNTYKAVRIAGKGYNLYYSVWCNNEHELYNLDDDPHQINNILAPAEVFIGPNRFPGNAQQAVLGHSVSRLAGRLDALLLVLKSCQGKTCVRPWDALHPDGSVQTLAEALAPSFDVLYQELPSVRFERCELGHILDAEGPQFEAAMRPRYGGRLQDWT